MDAGPSDADAAGSALAAIQLNDWNDFNGLEDDAAEIRRRAYEMERRADEQWRIMHKEQLSNVAVVGKRWRSVK